jgi:hypothetical protein
MTSDWHADTCERARNPEEVKSRIVFSEEESALLPMHNIPC